jgi:protein-tyrosine-phosphatase
MSPPEDPGPILFVCTGNTCRSPLAAALAGRSVAERGGGPAIESAGLSTLAEDAPASREARTVAQEAGLELESHRTRLLTRPMVLAARLVLTMSARQLDFIRVLAPEGVERVHTLRGYATRGADPADVRDPFGGDLDAYRRTLGELRELVERSLLRWYEEAASPRR